MWCTIFFKKIFQTSITWVLFLEIHTYVSNMMTCKSFQLVLHLTKVIKNFMVITHHFILTISLKFFAELQKFLDKILEKKCDIFCLFWLASHQHLVFVAWSRTHNKNMSQFFKNFLQGFLKFSKKFQRNCWDKVWSP